MARVKEGCDKHLAHIQQQPYTNTYALDVCECVTTRNLCKTEVARVAEVVCKFRRTRYKYKISHPYKNCNSICTTDSLSGALQDTSSSHLALYSYFAPTISLALNGNLLQYLVGSLLWHITASTAISIFATFYYFIANTKGASAILHVTTSTSSFPTSSTTLPLSSTLNTSLTAPTTTNISAFKGTTNSSNSSSHVAFYNHNSTVSSNFFNIFVESNYSSNSTEIAASNSPNPLPPNKYDFPEYSFDNKNNNDNDNDNKSNYNLSSIITLSYNNLTAFNETFDEISDEVASEYIFDRTDVRIIFITLYTMVFCCCFLGNLLVILVVTLSRRLRSITNFFLANLALADFCVGLFCVMQNLSIYLIDSWVFGEFLCRMYQFVHSLSYTASIFILVVICTERYFAIVHPITSKQILTAPRLRMVILTVWITSALYSTPKFVFSKTIKNVHTESGREEEICVLDRKMFSSKVLDMINFGLLYVIPLLVMTVLYTKIAVALWRSSRGLQHHLAQQENSMGMHNSMYHRHNSQLHHHHHQPHQLHSHHQELSLQLSHQQQQQGTIPLGASLTANSPNVSGSSLTRKQSCKYDVKRGVNITESQVSLDADRPVVSTCRKTSFYNHLSNQKQTQPPAFTNHLRSHAQHHNLHGSQRVSHISHSSNNVLRARRGVVRMLIIFVLAFALCNLPYHARKMWQYWSRSYRGDSNFNALLTPLTFLVTYFNSGINPLLYAFLSRNFRKGMKELLLCSWRKSKTKSSTNSSMHHKRLALQTNSLPTDVTHIGNEQL